MGASAEQKGSREGHVYFRRQGRQAFLAEYLEDHCRPLLGTELFFDKEGSIFYYRWRSLPREGLLPPQFILVSRLHPQADIYAPHTRYPHRREMQIVPIRKDNGSVEAAIRAMDHVLEGERSKETQRTGAVKNRAHELFDLFSSNFSAIGPEEFAAAREQTFALLRQVGLDPDQVIDEEMQRMATFLLKGSSGRDSTGRENMMVSLGALAAAYRRAISRRWGIDEIISKFLQMREALILDREFSRGIFTDVASRLKSSAMPSHVLFTKPDTPAKNLGPVFGLLSTMRFQLTQLHLKPYRPVGSLVTNILTQIENWLREDRRREIAATGLFSQAYAYLTDTLACQRDIYPSNAT